MQFQKKMEELYEFLGKWQFEVREELQLGGVPDHVIKAIVEGAPKLASHSAEMQIESGNYVSKEGCFAVRVLNQDPKQGLIVLELLDVPESQDRFQTISPGLFNQLFRRENLEQLTQKQFEEFYQTEQTQSESVQKEHLAAREKSFGLASVEAAHGRVAQKYTQLYEALLRSDTEEMHAIFLEFLYLVFVLGARLGFSPRLDFHALYNGVFELIDRTFDECMLTKRYYDELEVETRYEEFRLYDPVIELAPPVVYYITISTANQRSKNGFEYQEGDFLPAQRAAVRITAT
jgi:hypothetical protein